MSHRLGTIWDKGSAGSPGPVSVIESTQRFTSLTVEKRGRQREDCAGAKYIVHARHNQKERSSS